jgi:hypothetical protein
MVLIDASTRWSHMCLLSTRNHAFTKIMAQVIKLKANFSKHQMQSIRLYNVADFSSRAFNDYCMAQEIEVQHSVPFVHTQNDLIEYLIKRIKLIAQSLLHNCNLPITCWSHAVLHAADLTQLQPTAYHTTSLYTLYVVMLQVFLICRNLDAQYMHQFHSLNVLYVPSQENGNLCGISLPVHYKIFGAPNWGFVYNSIH